VRVDSKNTSQVFIDVPTFHHNAIVASVSAVNRAMDGDTVAGSHAYFQAINSFCIVALLLCFCFCFCFCFTL
jgi:hypothetical protein